MKIFIAVAVLAAAIAAGWYVSHPSAAKREQARKEEDERSRKAYEDRVKNAGTNKNPNPFRGGPPSEMKDRLIREAAEREAQKKQ
jgi:hypothetical protein